MTSELLIRDDFTYEEYFQSRFDIIDFQERDIDIEELEFFNPLSNKVPSASWSATIETDYSIARKGGLGPFYRVIKAADALLFADEPINAQDDSFISYEYRRIYFALKAHYGNPLKANVSRLDEEYSQIEIGGHLPNREYYYLLLLSWPLCNAFDKINFLLKNDFVQDLITTLQKLGIEVKGGHLDA